ncbi:hypothetical protein [Massilia endophytica]|uniref:hypothetical protein n=1 Tax=Massilia endophytica TaxID=2899220 RepID=UPI001E293D2A|nr:hypothetical protein [Massilia endophytica]UGQ47980.1 hypothetical protein LSQ66_05810 [Massilia endophytica]
MDYAHFDAEELLHLAIQAIGDQDHAAAIGRLKRSLELDPAVSQAHYLLGIEYALIGMAGRAIDTIGRALALSPDMPLARFQLGMLLVTSGRMDEARSAWAPLDGLGDGHPLQLFKAGVLHLVSEEFDEAGRCIAAGIAANTVNQALNRDMQRVLERLEQGAAPAPQAPVAADAAPHLAVAAYHGNGSR